MEKERKQDLHEPDDEALEQHVREMLDVNEPEVSQSPSLDPGTVEAPKATTIPVIHHDEVPSAPEVPAAKIPVQKKTAGSKNKTVQPEKPVDSELVAAIQKANEELEQQTETAPAVPSKTKKVAITHFEDTPETPDAIGSEEITESTPEVLSEEAPEDIELVQESPLEADIESADTEQAVNDIIATEGDELLAAKDEELAKATVSAKKGKKQRKNPFKSSGFRWAIAFILMAAILAAAVTPTIRYGLLNTLGVRSSASVLVLDQSTQQPLKNVMVTLAGQEAKTDANGTAKLEKLRLGPTELVVEKRAFARMERVETVGWGSNPLADVSLKPTGSQYSFTVTDALSGKPLGNAEATYNDSNANADEKGVITLTLDKQSDGTVKVQIKAAGYRDETVDVSLSSKQNTDVKLIPDHKIAFISKRSGMYDVYTVDADSKNERLVLKGTGNEQSNLTLAPHPSKDVAVLVASRAGNRGTDGSLLTDMTFINLKDGQTKQIAESSSIRAIDWIGTRFIYVQTTKDAKADDPQRDKLMSFDYVSGDNRQLAASNYFNDIVSANGKLYYAPSSAYQNGVNLGMFTVHADGSGKQSVFDKEVWSIARVGYDHFVLAVQQDWYDYVPSSTPTKLNGQPSNTAPRQYTDSPDSKVSAWLDTRDGKPAVVLYDTATKNERVLVSQSGLKGPIRWVGSGALIYRIVSSQETADYIVSVNGGQPQKLANVTDFRGITNYAY